MRIFLLILFLSIVFTILFTWPFATKLGSFYSDSGDYPFNGWLLWYNYDSIVSGRIFNQEQYFNSKQLYSYPNSLSFGNHLFLPSLIFLPLYALTHNLIISVNLTTFISFVLTIFTSFYCFRYFLKNSCASLIAALVYTFNPLTFAQFYSGHLEQLFKFLLPVYFVFLYRFLKTPNLKDSLLLFSSLTTTSLVSTYHFIFILTVTPLLIIFTSIYNRKIINYFKNLGKFSLIF